MGFQYIGRVKITKAYNMIFSKVVIVLSFIYEYGRLRLSRLVFWFLASRQTKDDEKGQERISIILPTYNRSDLLFSRAIPSVLNQTFQNWELLVVSHGCTDGTEAKVRKMAQADSRIRLICCDRKRLGYPAKAENHWLVGPVRPINKGLRFVTGCWIARIDDDDTWYPTHLETLVGAIRDTNAEFVSSSYEVRDEQGWRKIEPTGTPPIGGVQTWVYRSYLKFFRAHISSWRKSWNRVNDTDLQERFVRAGVRVAAIPDTTVKIEPRPGEKFVGIKAYLSDRETYEDKYGK